MSGKRKKTTATKTEIIGVRVTPDLYNWIRDAAEGEGLSIGTLIRRELLKMRKQKGRAA